MTLWIYSLLSSVSQKTQKMLAGLSAWESSENRARGWMEGEGYKKRVSQHNVGNLIQTMWNFDNMEEPLIAGTQFDKGAI